MAVKTNSINMVVQQGDMEDKINCFGSAVVEGDYEPLKDILNASGEYAVIGCNISKVISPAPVITGGSDGVKLVSGTLILEREAAKPIYFKTMLPDDETKVKAIGVAFLNKTIGGAKVTKVTQKTAGTQLA